jgi:hypothetical protein
MPHPLPVLPRTVVVPVALIVVAFIFASGVGEAILAPLGLDALDWSAQEVRGVMLRAGAAFAISKTINADDPVMALNILHGYGEHQDPLAQWRSAPWK